MSQRIIVVVLIALAIFSVIVLFMKRGKGKEVEVSELPIAWPPADELVARWCGSGTKMASTEVAVISCNSDCYALVRYWIFFPADVELSKEIPIEIWENGSKIFEKNVTMVKKIRSIYVQTPVLLVRLPAGSELRIGDSKVKVPDCLKGILHPPQVIYTRGIVENWENPVKGLNLVKLSDHIFLARWEGSARISCGNASLDLRQLDIRKGDLAIISAGERCKIEVNGRDVPL